MSENNKNFGQSSQLDLITQRVTKRFKRRFFLAVFCIPASIAWFGIVLRGINSGMDIFTTFLIAFISLLVLLIVFWPIYLITMDNQISSTVTELISGNKPLTPEVQELLGDNINLPEDSGELLEETTPDTEQKLREMLEDPSQSDLASQALKSMLYESQLKG